jgi:hypothetical protein
MFIHLFLVPPSFHLKKLRSFSRSNCEPAKALSLAILKKNLMRRIILRSSNEANEAFVAG